MNHGVNELVSPDELQNIIATAMKKVATEDENKLCFYLPGPRGRLYHWGLKRMKSSSPQELIKLLKAYIIEKDSPVLLSEKRSKRVVDGSVSKTIEVKFKKSEINRLTEILKNSGNAELLALFTPFQSLAQVQKLMIEMIKKKRADLDLWGTYLRLLQENKESSPKNLDQ